MSRIIVAECFDELVAVSFRSYPQAKGREFRHETVWREDQRRRTLRRRTERG
jgi:hypothetical protein